ncbi:thioredoxin family protein [Maribacter ulvicola]|uniref:Thioredoxin 1 n=1 Tax=Maribacter ulvicola TaxID=228959 RepID=A0A1N6Z417_9FLAO|nr:thioredoxin family protein [Maribacter ulvicola]SIR21564.1 thioredoxin 1 [Maribacter ulvicola]
MKKKFRKSIGSDTPTLVYFYAPWCVPCKLMRPVVEQVIGEYPEILNYIEIDVEIKKGIVKRYKIKGVPTLILFQNGTPLWRHTGVIPIEDIKMTLKEHI